MPIKPGAKTILLKEQIIEDLATGLTFQFERYASDGSVSAVMRIYGDALPFGNREIVFNADGEECGGGTTLVGDPKASWLHIADGTTE